MAQQPHVLNTTEGKSYIHERKIDQLFMSLMTGIVHHRPTEPIIFLQRCIEHIEASGLKPEDVFWDTFLDLDPKAPDDKPTVTQASKEPDGGLDTHVERSGDESKPRNRRQWRRDKAKEYRKNHERITSVVTSTASANDAEQEQRQSLVDTLVDDDEDDVLNIGAFDEEDESGAGIEAADVLAPLGPLARPIFEGHYENLPAMQSNIVRIFLSSTFSDFKAERNYLPGHAYPALQAYCLEKGLDFQVVDMRWGVTDELANDHQVSELCLDEVRRCQQISKGPNFVAMLGNRYGYQPFPAKIDATEFEIFWAICEELELEKRVLLKEWFFRDDNAQAPEYVLQPIAQKLKHYADEADENQQERSADRKKWLTIKSDIQDILRRCADAAKERELIDTQTHNRYFQSVTEEEIHQGLFMEEGSRDHVLCFVRSLDGLTKYVEKPDTSKYLDITNGCVDQFSQDRLKQLTDQRIPECLESSKLNHYTVPWLGQVLEKSNDINHQQYLKEFSEDFVRKIIEMIEKSYNQEENEELESSVVLYNEVIHHATFSRMKTEVFHGREKETELIRHYLSDGCRPKHSPLLVVAESGAGKTAFMASIALKVRSLCGENSRLVIRFLGTSPSSSDILQTLKSIVMQIGYLYNISDLFKPNRMKTFGDARREFWKALERISAAKIKIPLLIILDAVDQFEDTNNVFGMTWLPRFLPHRIFLIVSMLPNAHSCLENARQRIHDPTRIVQLTTLSDTDAEQIIQSTLKRVGRCLTTQQDDYILGVFHKCKQPLFLKLLLDNAITWHSYTLVNQVELPRTVREAIYALFESIEVRFGSTFVCHSLGYLTCGKGGLTSIEMEDALSCDDIVLNAVYRYHDPPLEDVVRIPSLMWSRVQQAFSIYLAERQVHGKTVYTWYHRQFWEAAQDRYLSDRKQFQYLHSTLADIFLQETGIRRTIILENRGNKVMEHANRCVAHQPLTPKNLRKLSVLTYHLYSAGRIEELKHKCLFSFTWILTKLVAQDVFSLLKEYELFMAEPDVQDATLGLITDFLILVADDLFTDNLLLAYQLIERLDVFVTSDEAIAKLHGEAQKWLNQSPYPALVPTRALQLRKPGSPLKMQLLLGTKGKLTEDQTIIVCNHIDGLSANSRYNIFNIATKDLLASIRSGKSTFYNLTRDGRQFIYVDFSSIVVCEVASGDKLVTVRFETRKFDKITIRCATLNSSETHYLVGVKLVYTANADKEEQGRSEVMFYLIDLKRGQVVTTAHFRGRRPMNTVHFLPGDKAVITTLKSNLYMLDPFTLEVVHETPVPTGEMLSHTNQVHPKSGEFLTLTKHKRFIKVLVFNSQTKEVTYSSSQVNLVTETNGNAFSLKVNPDATRAIVGCYSEEKDSVPVSSICLWNRIDDTYLITPLSGQGFRGPSALSIHPDWCYAVVGWSTGSLTLVDVNQGVELRIFPAVGQPISAILALENGHQLLTFEVNNTTKMWDLDMLISLAKGKESPEGLDNELDTPGMLNTSTECLDFAILGDRILSASPNSKAGPQLLQLDDGKPCGDVTLQLDTIYKEACANAMAGFDSHTHGHVTVLDDDIIVYERKTRDKISVCCMRMEGNMPTVVAYMKCEETFLSFITKVPLGGTGVSKHYIFLRRAEVLEVYTIPDLSLAQKVNIPNIHKDIPNTVSRAMKKRLEFQTCGVTHDGKYYIAANFAVIIYPKGYKPLDVVDLKHGTAHRFEMPRQLGIKFLAESFNYMYWEKGQSPLLLSPQKYSTMKRPNGEAYQNLLDCKWGTFLSPDRSIGVEIHNKKHLVHLWQISPLKRLHVLRGHTMELKSVNISTDNKYVVTGSVDKTVRVWSVDLGQQICSFRLDGGVEDLHFDGAAEYIAVKCYDGPRRTRLVVLKFLKGKRSLLRRDTKVIFSSDLSG